MIAIDARSEEPSTHAAQIAGSLSTRTRSASTEGSISCSRSFKWACRGCLTGKAASAHRSRSLASLTSSKEFSRRRRSTRTTPTHSDHKGTRAITATILFAARNEGTFETIVEKLSCACFKTDACTNAWLPPYWKKALANETGRAIGAPKRMSCSTVGTPSRDSFT